MSPSTTAAVVLVAAGDEVTAHQLEVVRVARALGAAIVVLVGPDPAAHVPCLAGAGASVVEMVRVDGSPVWSPDVAGAALADAATRYGASWVLADGTPEGDEAAALAALRLDADLVVGAVSIGADGAVTTRPAAGRWSVTTRTAAPAVVTLLAGADVEGTDGGPDGAASGDVSVVELEVPVGGRWAGVRVEAEEALDGLGRPSLAQATVVVGAGRGAVDHLDLVERLADLMAGAVGATRAVVDAGGVDRHLQIGQSGQRISPRVYVAVGVSGALQHLAGVSASTTLVAVNADPQAPVFQAASYGVVGDAGAVLKQAVDLLAAGR